jgi:hypothetical protein
MGDARGTNVFEHLQTRGSSETLRNSQDGAAAARGSG